MRASVWWVAVVGYLSFVACGKSTSKDDDGAADGGTAGASGSSDQRGGTTNAAGGRGGATTAQGGTTARGGTTAQGGTIAGDAGSDASGGGMAGDDTHSGGAGAGGDAGGGGVPGCMLAGGNTCSFQAACDVLGCGTAWSQYDEQMCVRTSCAVSGLCEAGERCVAAPVGGRFDDPCGNQADSCDPSGSGCECLYYEECFPSAVCLPVSEYPPENDCPIAELDCDGLAEAAETLEGYLEGDVFLLSEPYEAPGNIRSSLQACWESVNERLTNECEG